MPATVPTRGVLKASTNRVRTSLALQGNSMWENVIGVVNEHAGANQGVEALINAPQHGGGRKRSAEARAAAAEAVMATGGFDTAITNYASLLDLAKSQGAVGGGSNRGACRVCGQVGHLTKQCRNQFSRYYQAEAGEAPGPSGAGAPALAAGDAPAGLPAPDDDVSDLSNSSLSSDEERRRKKKRKQKSKDRKSSKSSKKGKKEKSSKDKKERKSSSKHKKKRRKHSSSGSSGSSDSE